MKPLLDGIVGARPNMMKMAPLAKALADDGGFDLRIVENLVSGVELPNPQLFPGFA